MTKKEKILFSFITNIIDDEKPKTLHVLTRYDISKLLKNQELLKKIHYEKIFFKVYKAEEEQQNI